MTINATEVRTRQTDTDTYYVLGTQCRKDLINLIQILRSQPIPKDFNKNDEDALTTMADWLKADRDFSMKQWSKFSKMIAKYGLPSRFDKFAESADWTRGKALETSESASIMQKRRDKKAKKKQFIEAASNLFDELFE